MHHQTIREPVGKPNKILGGGGNAAMNSVEGGGGETSNILSPFSQADKPQYDEVSFSSSSVLLSDIILENGFGVLLGGMINNQLI